VKRESGFTLLEVLLVATLLGMIVAVIVPNLGVGFRIWSSTDESMSIIQDSRLTLQKILKDIRNAEEIIGISSESISLRDKNGDSISYGLFYFSGKPYLGYSLNGSEWSKLTGPLDWIQMEYYDQSGEPTDQPSLVRLVKISFSVEGNEFSSKVYRPAGDEVQTDSPSPFPIYAITAGIGGIEMTGSSKVGGSNGSIRAIGNIVLKGNVNVSGDVISSGLCILIGNPTVGGEIQSFAGLIEIPLIDPWSLLDSVQYVLGLNGKVYDDKGHIVGNKSFGPWKFSGGKWRISGNKECDGVYFVMTEVYISGTAHGQTTIISTGDIKVSGAVNLSTATQEGYLLLSAGEIELSGSGNYKGLVVGLQGVDLSGSVKIEGALIGNGAEVSGSSMVIFNGEYQIPNAGEAKLHILSWSEE